MNHYETLGTKLSRWLIIWFCLFLLICLAAVITHWDTVCVWFQSSLNAMIELGFQILLMIIAIFAMMGFFSRH